jgi:opacity protein-like surface antigen
MKARAVAFAAALAGSLAAAGAAQAQEVNVLTAWYGQSCGAAHGNVTAHVKSRCDGRRQCDYAVDVAALGDAAPNCSKNFVVLYGCRGQPAVRLAQLPAEAHGRVAVISCAPPPAPPQPVSR